MARKKAHAGGHANSERWLLTYADLITLLLIYFIVLFAMSQIDVAKYHKLADAMSDAFNVIPSTSGSQDSVLDGSPAVMPPVAPMYSYEEAQFQTIKKQVEKAFKDAGLKQALDITETQRGLIIHIEDNALFTAGSADVNPKMATTLAKVASALRASSNNVRVEGHTDDTPIHTARFPSNWELSTDRAVNVLHYLIDNGHLAPSRLSAAGYGEYFPRVPNDSEANRAKNRRVDIVLLRNATMAQEPGKPDFLNTSSALPTPISAPKAPARMPSLPGHRPEHALPAPRQTPPAPDLGLGEGY